MNQPLKLQLGSVSSAAGRDAHVLKISQMMNLKCAHLC